MPAWLTEEAPEQCLLRLLIQPKAARSEIVGSHGEPARLKIRIAAPPVEGAANDELLDFLKKTVKLPRSSLEIVRGHEARTKDVRLRGVTSHDLLARLGFGDQINSKN